LTNYLLLPGFQPFFDLSHSQASIGMSNKLIVAAPEPLRWACSAILLMLFLYDFWPKVKPWLVRLGAVV
jgi:hypothetical protein